MASQSITTAFGVQRAEASRTSMVAVPKSNSNPFEEGENSLKSNLPLAAAQLAIKHSEKSPRRCQAQTTAIRAANLFKFRFVFCLCDGCREMLTDSR